MIPYEMSALNKMTLNHVYLIDYDSQASSVQAPIGLIEQLGANDLHPTLTQQDKDLINRTSEVYSDKKSIWHYLQKELSIHF